MTGGVVRLVAFALAVWRLTVMVHRERGPFAVLETLRNHTYGEPRQVLLCPSCLSVWVAAALWWAPNWALSILAGSAVTKLIEDYFYRMDYADLTPESELASDAHFGVFPPRLVQ